MSKPPLLSLTCPFCGKGNDPDSHWCWVCHGPLTPEARESLQPLEQGPAKAVEGAGGPSRAGRAAARGLSFLATGLVGLALGASLISALVLALIISFFQTCFALFDQ